MESTADVVFLLIGVASIAFGIKRGLSGEFVSLLGLVGGTYCALNFSAPIAKFFISQFGLYDLAAKGLSMFAIFIAVLFGASLLNKSLKKVIRIAHLSLMDRLGGALAGALKAYILFLIVFVGAALLSPIITPKWMKDSTVMELTAKSWPSVYPILEAYGIIPEFHPEKTLDYFNPIQLYPKGGNPKKNSTPLTLQEKDDSETP